MNNLPDPRSEISRLHVESHKRALKELSREDLEAFALVEYGLAIYYCCHVLGEESPNVGNLMTFGMEYEWLDKVTEEVVNRVILRSREIAESIKKGN